MSKPNDNNDVINITSLEQEKTESVEKQSLVQRGKNFVKTHKKATIAVAALTGLVGVSAYAGRKTAPSIDDAQPSGTYDFDDMLADVTELDTDASASE